MFAKAFVGSRNYYLWLTLLFAAIGAGTICYLIQYFQGLGVTGMSRDVTWGFYIAQFTFLVGVAASAVMVVLPYYLHNYKQFGKITVLGEFLAVASVIMCCLFIFVDLGQPLRVMNVIFHPTPNSVMFWDMCVLQGYLLLNIVIAWVSLDSERNGIAPPKWIKPFVYLSIPWAVSIHTVTAFLICGLPGRHFWLTAIMAPRFLASAFAAGPALLIILCLVLRRLTKFDAGKEAIQKLAVVVLYAMIVNVFFFLLEVFTAFYSGIPGHKHALEYLLFGLHDHNMLTPYIWLAAVLAFVSIFTLLKPSLRRNETLLGWACAGIFIASWIDKGLCLIVAGFVPTPMETITEYNPTFIELTISIGVYAIGALILTLFYKVAVTVKEEVAGKKPQTAVADEASA